MSREEKLTQFVDWAQHHITGDEKGQAQTRRREPIQLLNSEPAALIICVPSHQCP